MKFDRKYFNELADWVRLAKNGIYDVSNPKSEKAIYFTRDIEKFISHLKWYALKNNDLRHVVILTEDKKYKFELGDIYIKGCCAVGFLPEEIRLKRMERIMSCFDNNIIKPVPPP